MALTRVPSSMRKLSVVSKTTTYTATDVDDVILCSGAAFTVNLPTAVGISGKEYTIRKTDASFSNIFTIDPNASETIGGVATTTLNTIDETIRIMSDGTNWIILSRTYSTDETAYTPTFTNFGTVSQTEVTWQRQPKGLYLKGRTLAGTMGGGPCTFTLPSGLTSLAQTYIKTIGVMFAMSAGATDRDFGFNIAAAASNTLNMSIQYGGGYSTAAWGTDIANASVVDFWGFVPITGWN